ncbi:ABC transporter ATP-binding protein [Candidatus Formimonas warabiya]|uniref:Multidrug ABC transporter ATP-binding protein n=1 Tax=Formimonas warabiya TaxID=1761012 RepID=A0A3G1KTI6_FORW1|nr:ABC transporter ATP-binding protein [Candidatus Formimonas warabiya]ATW25769.1 multidrug ABC transporter ATP-binding protein [Candidatus Formimonas warabiya]
MFKMVKRLSPAAVFAAIVFLLVQVVCLLYLPYVTADIVNKGLMTGNISYIWSKGFLMIVLSVAGLVGALLNTFLFSKLSYQLGGELRADLYRKAMRFSKHEFDKFGASSLMTRNTNDVAQVQNLVEMAMKFLILSPAMLFGGIAMTYLLSPELSLIFLGTVPFLAVAAFVIYRFASPLYARMQKLLDSLNLFFREGLSGVKVIRAFNKEKIEYEKYKRANQEYTKTSITAATIMSVFSPLITMITSLSTLLIVWIGGNAVAAGTMEIGTIMGAISYSGQILMGFGMLTSVILAVPRGQISAGRIQEVLDMPASINDPKQAIHAGHEKIRLALENVGFRYPGAGKKTLEGISLTVQKGQTLAVIGNTGGGKSSLVNLIARLYDVESGHIRINNTDIRDLDQKTLRQLVSFSPQKSTLFFGTIRANMLMGKPDATDHEIWAALEMAQATEFVRTLPKGLDSVVEKSGGNFSGGQKQRLCIARALLKDARIYIFDDAFSALDFKTDAAVRTAMKEKLRNAITVIVAQRVSTIMDADLIAVLDKGKLAGLGTHEQLSASNPVYQEIIQSQFYTEVVA